MRLNNIFISTILATFPVASAQTIPKAFDPFPLKAVRIQGIDLSYLDEGLGVLGLRPTYSDEAIVVHPGTHRVSDVHFYLLNIGGKRYVTDLITPEGNHSSKLSGIVQCSPTLLFDIPYLSTSAPRVKGEWLVLNKTFTLSKYVGLDEHQKELWTRMLDGEVSISERGRRLLLRDSGGEIRGILFLNKSLGIFTASSDWGLDHGGVLQDEAVRGGLIHLLEFFNNPRFADLFQ